MDSPGASDKALRLWRALNGDLDKHVQKVLKKFEEAAE